MPVSPLESYIVVTIDEVDVTNRLAHCQDKTGSNIICTFRTTGAGTFAVPAQGDRWLAVKLGHIWHLRDRLDTQTDQEWNEAHLQSGDLRVDAPRMWVGTQGGSSGRKLGFYGHTPIVQPLLATGAGHTVDDVIAVLQSLGLVRQT